MLGVHSRTQAVAQAKKAELFDPTPETHPSRKSPPSTIFPPRHLVRSASPQPADKIEIDRYLDDVRPQLDERTFEKAWAEGRAMSLEDAVALALDENVD